MKEKIFSLIFCLVILASCTSTGKTYENKNFPTGEWKPINQPIQQMK